MKIFLPELNHTSVIKLPNPAANKLSCILRTVAYLLILLVSYSSVGLATQIAAAKKQSTAYKTSSGTTVTFPDVCLTPSPAGPIPIPYPTINKSKGNDQKMAKKKTKTGESLVFLATRTMIKGRMQTITDVTFMNQYKQTKPIIKSTLFAMADGSYCAVCIKGQKVSQILKLQPVSRVATQIVPKKK